MPPSHEVQSLYAIADKIDSGQPLEGRLDAMSLLELIKNEALAFRVPDSSKLSELVGCFHHCQAMAASYPGSKRLEDSILQFMTLIDECFFFKTLTRTVETKKGRQNLVSLEVEDDHYPRSDGRCTKGMWRRRNRTVTLWLKGTWAGEPRYRFRIEWVLHTCVHESIHAFICLFANENHPNHNERVIKDRHHGSIFIEILRVIGERVDELTNSREWTKGRYLDPFGLKKERPGAVHLL
ncbi:hypothetical protein CIB48_g6696 [Xylaria polymorpha]|nr:hypothetical protein CIB48_g6696 [Xylaria polymorpha]